MPRDWSTDLQEIHEAYKRRDTLDVYLADDTALRLSRGKVIRTIGGSPVEYENYIRSVGDLNSSFEKSIDRIEIVGQNVNSELGFNLASDLRLLDYAVCDYGKSYQSIRNPSLIEDNQQVFRGVLADAEADEEFFKFILIVDFESLGNIIALRGLSPKCFWSYKNGIECTSVSSSLTCMHTRRHCKKNGVEHENGGFEYYEEPTSLLPGTGGNGGGGNCFTLDTKIWTPNGEIPIGDLPVGKMRESVKIVSFDENTGELCYEDEIEEVFEHEANGYFTFSFAHAEVKVTPEHRILTQFGEFKAADKFKINDTARGYIADWFDPHIFKIKWHSDAKTKVRNLHVRKNHTYFANRLAVHNRKDENEILT